MVALSTANTQAVVYKYEHMNSRNDRLDLRLNPLQREIYFVENGKSYVINCNYA